MIAVAPSYGTGSSRDWAAKGTALLGVRAVIAESFERIHRSNLIQMGVLPLRVPRRRGRANWIGLTGHETLEVAGIAEGLRPGMTRLRVRQSVRTEPA